MLTWDERAELERRWYPRVRDVIWGRLQADLETVMRSDARVLDAGGGQGTWLLRRYRGRVRSLIGVDLYLPRQHNLDSFAIGSLDALPFAGGCFDVILCHDVIEHLAQPERSLAELTRVLRPPSYPHAHDGGVLFFKTPSLLAPATLITQLLPFCLHRWLKQYIGVSEEAVFPTLFRCNTPMALDHALSSAGLEREWLLLVDETFGYFAFHRIAYVIGLLYSRLMHMPPFRPLRNVIIGMYRRVV
ncbi:MAG TPA: class I SAM-dependent methyltransferase [Anaerolineae bacterium]|nr:class I SAM-dependent methyltransferase [Anaerolineae bacterium]HIQ05616.1 class I SAM-dependent methyltransferase [Anaerolineae bacterium]